MKRHAYILGAGPTGLITAWQLLKRNWDVTILEKNEIVGGLCRSWKRKNFILDTGPHIFHTPDKELEKFWKKHFGDLFVEGKFWCKNVKGKNFDKFYDYPLSIESIKNYDSELKKKIFKEIKNLDKDSRYEAKNYSQYIDSFVGKTLREMFFEKYPKKIWGIDTKLMTPEWAPHRIKFRKKIEPFYSEEYAAVGKYGTGPIYERIYDFIKKLNGVVKFKTFVKGFEYETGKIKKIISNKKVFKVDANDIVISTLPLNLTSNFLGLKSKLKFRGICSVYLFYNVKKILKDKKAHWLYFDSDELMFNRVTENKKLSKFTCPNNKSFVTAEITYSLGDNFSKMNPFKIITTVRDQFKKLKLVDDSKYLDGYINFEPFVYPVQFSNFKNEIAKVKSHVESFNNLHSLGAGGEFNYADSQILFHKSFDLVHNLTSKFNKLNNEIKNNMLANFNKTVKIPKNDIGDGSKCFIIAEAGLNHNGSIQIAKKLIDNAKKIGCDAIKFQSFTPDSRVSSKVKAERYVEKIIDTQESISKMFNRLSLNFTQQKKLFEYAKKKKIEIFSTPFDNTSADYLEKLGVNLFKIASVDLVNLPLIEYVAKKQKPVILSTGMSNLSDIDEAVQTVKKTGNENLMILHCNSSYPSNYSEMNLKFIDTLKKIYNVPVGLSDHTTDLLACKVAISRGCNLIEKHFTLSKEMEGPDHILSADFGEMNELVKSVKNINDLLGDGIKKIQPNEYNTINSQRKSIYAGRDIKKGQILTSKNLSIKGPSGGIMPKFLNIVLNRKAKKNIKKDEPITWSDV